MKLFTSLALIVFFIVGGLVTVHANTSKYVEIKKAFTPVYKFLDPQSQILVQATKNETYELVYEGTSWYHVKVDEDFGWIEKSAGKIVDSPATTFLSIPIGTLMFFLLLLIATITGASFLIYKQKTVEL